MYSSLCNPSPLPLYTAVLYPFIKPKNSLFRPNGAVAKEQVHVKNTYMERRTSTSAGSTEALDAPPGIRAARFMNSSFSSSPFSVKCIQN